MLGHSKWTIGAIIAIIVTTNILNLDNHKWALIFKNCNF